MAARRILVLGVLSILGLTACVPGGAAPVSSTPVTVSLPAAATVAPTTSASAPATAGPTGQPSQSSSVVVTFLVAGSEKYRIRLTDPAKITIARKLLAGEAAPHIPNGLVVRGDPDVNTGYTWHIDPDSVEFADTAVEVCDGLPSYVEKGIITSDRYCPWAAKVIAID